MDGSISVWDLREPFNLHLANLKKKKFSSEENVMRSPTYSTGYLSFINLLFEKKTNFYF